MLLAELRQRIRHLETPQPWLQDTMNEEDDHIVSSTCPLDIPDIDQILPGGGLFPRCAS